MGTRRKVLGTVVFAVALLVSGPNVYASVRLEDAGNVPYYARLLPGAEWSALIFYRPPSCVPTGFNLLDFFDFANASNCNPPTTDGFSIWKNGPGIDFAPLQLHLEGLGAVPIYFVRTTELDAAAADGVLTIGEVTGLSSLIVGTASAYHEVLHPDQGAKVGKLTIVARGMLDDGRTFRFHVSTVNRHYHVQIDFK